jgi:hypothetical protein
VLSVFARTKTFQFEFLAKTQTRKDRKALGLRGFRKLGERVSQRIKKDSAVAAAE